MSTPCPKEDHHTEHEHIDLGDGWAHLKRKPTHAEAQEVQAAQHAANYEPAGASQMTQALIKSVLMATPEEWKQEHFEPTMDLVERFLDQYETNHETALLSPQTRKNMAEARMALFDVYARVFFVESSVGDTYPLEDAIHCEIVQAKARDIWTVWVGEVRDRLKAVGADSD